MGTNVPKQYMAGIEKGFRTVCEKGHLTGIASLLKFYNILHIQQILFTI